MRSLPDKGTMYLIAHSAIGLDLPEQLQCGEAGGIPALIDRGGALYLLSATPVRATTRPAGDGVPAPTEEQLAAALKPLQLTPTAAPPVVEASGSLAYQVRYACTNCHGKPVTVLDVGRVVGPDVVDCIAPVPAEDPKALAAAESNSALLLHRAKVVHRLAVAGHSEQRPPAPPVATAAPTRSMAGSTAGSMPGSTAAPGRTAGNGPLTPAAARLNAQAATALAAAQKLKADGKGASAYDHFRYVAKQYAKTPAGAEAQSAVAAYEADPDFMATYRAKGSADPSAPTTRPAAAGVPAAQRAASLLSLADQYVSRGRPDLARAKYQAVIDQFPTLPAAATARDRLAKLSVAP